MSKRWRMARHASCYRFSNKLIVAIGTEPNLAFGTQIGKCPSYSAIIDCEHVDITEYAAMPDPLD